MLTFITQALTKPPPRLGIYLQSQRLDGRHDAFGDLVVVGLAIGGFQLMWGELDGRADGDGDA